MSGHSIASSTTTTTAAGRHHVDDPFWIKATLIGITLASVGLLLAMPLAVIFYEALRGGINTFLKSFSDPAAWHAIKLSLLATAISLPINTVFGVAAAWAIAKFQFRGKALLISIIDLPFAVSPVVAGVIFIILFGLQGWLGPWLIRHNLQVIFALPGIILATIFVTFPFVARELIPLMQEQGSDEEQAAVSLGASGWQIFWRVTLPNIRWGLLYGVVLCNARALGEFGAVSIVSGHIRNKTNTLPLHIEILFNEFHVSAAFAMATLLAMVGLLTLVAKSLLEWKVRNDLKATQETSVN